jgi:hypothetical protein
VHAPSRVTQQVVEVLDNDHSPLGPSGAKKWSNCAASVREEALVEDEQTEFAASGTASHQLSQWCREQNVRCEKFLGTILRVGAFDNLVDNDRVAAVNEFVDYMYALGGVQYCELRVNYGRWVRKGFGTLDGAAIVANTCHIVDQKDGSGVVVEAEGNEQLLLYALGWWWEFGWLHPEVDTFILHIVQPRVNHIVQSRPYSLEELLEWAEYVIKPRAMRTDDPDAAFTPGPWCSENFCRIKATCRARWKHLVEHMTGESDLKKVKSIRSVNRLTNDEVAELLYIVPQLMKAGGEIKAFAGKELQQGATVGDWKLVGGRSERRLTRCEDDVVKEVLSYAFDNDLAITKEDLFVTAATPMLSVAQLEKVVGKKAFSPGDAFTLPGPLAHLVVKSPGRPTVAPGTDSRPALAEERLSEFEDLGELNELSED